ncbi:hypothetical protein GCM10009682_34160 [Luedemannella flava]|uniref:Uncharacterized protein n=1 Tax=Luedemannella flava TaxID=349316 RepID=A0ABP4YGY2_9ACTN
MPIHEYPHPLQTDQQVVDCALVKAVRARRPDDSLAAIILAQSTVAEREWQAFMLRRPSGPMDMILLKSLLATADLHRRGIITARQEIADPPLEADDEKLIEAATAPYKIKKVLVATYGLTPEEVLAVEAYSNANKAVRVLPSGEANPHYMGAAQHWGPYGDGWAALAAGLPKIPTLGELGLTLTTYRAARAPKNEHEPTEITLISRLPVEANIVHGVTQMDMGQRHYLSTGVTYNSHWLRGAAVGGLIAVTGSAGYYINPFGLQGWLDGAEILYPPGFVTKFEGLNPRGYQVELPVAHLREVAGPESGQAVADDHKYTLAVQRHPGLDAEKAAHIAYLERPDRVTDTQIALLRLGLSDRGITYLTVEELREVRQRVG